MSNAAQRLGPPSGAGWTCKGCGTRNRVDDVTCSKCHKLAPLVAEALTREGKAEHSNAKQGDEHETLGGGRGHVEVHDNAIDLHTGQRSWEGEHRVVLVSRDLPMNAELLIDGKGIQNAKRIEIDVDCDKQTPIVKITQIELHEQQPEGSMWTRDLSQELTANLLNITLEEARVVDVILNKARQEASSNSMAVQLFALDSDTEDGERTRQTLDALLRDANRYRALRARIESEPEGVEMWYQSPEQLDHHADDQVQEQAETRRAARQVQS